MKPNAARFCGLDLGISTTDAVAEWAPESTVSLRSADPAVTAAEALRSLLAAAPPPDGERVVIAATGAGSHRLGPAVSGFAVRRVGEIAAIGLGGVRLAGCSEALVVSLGTGTAMVSVREGELRHVSPGSGVGGGSLLGLARALLGVDDLAELADLARRGDRMRLDITLGEAVGGPLGMLPASATASNFAKWSAGARREDVAAALVNLVAEVAIQVTLLGLQASGQTGAILTGRLLQLAPVAARIADVQQALPGLLVVPERAAVATALGAVWALREGKEA